MGIDAVIFDWGGTLTPWKNSDGKAWWRIAAQLVAPELVDEAARAATAMEEEVWIRSRDSHRSATLAEIFAAAGLAADEAAYAAFDAEWEAFTFLDPDAPAVLAALRERGLRIGILSNTTWPRARHEALFVRDGIDALIDAAVYTSDIPWTKPHPEAFRTAMAALGVTDPGRCVFVGDRPFDDIYGASRAGMRTVLIPHSDIPAAQLGHTAGEPDAVVRRLADLVEVVDAWRD